MASLVYLFLAILAAASAAPENRIVGGEDITIQNFPYIVSINYFYAGPGVILQRCAGALLSSWHVATSAYCFTGADLTLMQVRAGTAKSSAGGSLRNIQSFVIHPDYKEKPLSNDIAIAYLEHTLGIGSTIDVLYLPHPFGHLPDGTSLKIVGWGFESEGGKQLDTMKSITLSKIDIETCKAAYEGVEDVAITETALCATHPTRGICFGDSGAPLVINNALHGISSFFKGCQDDKYPDVFTSVAFFTEWIMEVAGGDPPSRDAFDRSGSSGRILNSPIFV